MKTANAVAQTRQDLIEDARRAVFDDLTSHDLFLAALALTQGAVPAFNDFMKMRGALLAGGLHRVRLKGGRGIDR